MKKLFRRNKSNKDVSASPKSVSHRTISTKILQINLDELKQNMDAEDEAKQQKLNKKLANKKKNKNDENAEYPEIKFRVEVDYNSHSWTVDRALDEFIALRKNLQTVIQTQLRPFALFPYGVGSSGASKTDDSSSSSSNSAQKKSHFGLSSHSHKTHASNVAALTGNTVTNTNVANAEAPFLREIRLALDRWLDAVVEDKEIQQTTYISQYLDWQKHKTALPSAGKGGLGVDKGAQPRRQNVLMDDFVLLKVLGKGSFGKVLLVRKKDDHQIYAMKCLKKQRVFQRHQVEHTKTERRVLGYLDHPFLVSLHYAFQTDQKLFLVLDYAAGGELFFHLSKAGRFTEDRTRFYIAEIVLAMEYLHSKDIIYRDLKPENVLLDSEGHVKITDFGLCKEHVPDNVSAHSFCGTPEYLAPEILRKVGHGKAADWWTLGALIYEMLCGVPPFYSRSRDALFDKILRQKIRFPNYFSRESIDVIKQLMQRNPKYRLGSRTGAGEVKLHIFFKGIQWEPLYRCEIEPPFKPRLSKDKHGVEGGANFDPEFTGMPIDSPDTNKRKYAPFEEFTFDGKKPDDLAQNTNDM
eukprot:CAMPEP_0202712440 /NCGR_PEP_ID=MMETSP1385-20130828/39944_1 /ASSEMBLY_ACC=CAM_ASM_000861 /TAXON_ID=933848 /ORGANISM="Elphidium margaritaceum" /LENGTH=578 /DNA_ID=CAMNT_0049372477 /DNA_START=91 /DNA_END=1827 /DNA_ORIENTATION=-